LRRVHKAVRKADDEPLAPEDWAAYFELASNSVGGMAG
jgi:hypothetical protein